MLQNAAENGFGRRPGSVIFVKDFALPEPQNLKIPPALRAGFVLQVAILKGQRQILDTNLQYFGRRAKRGGFLKKTYEKRPTTLYLWDFANQTSTANGIRTA